MSDRISCINPGCRITAPHHKHPGSEWIICRKCYHALPDIHRRRFKTLKQREKRLNRISRKSSYARPERHPQWCRLQAIADRSWQALTISIRHYFTAPESPVSIEDFLRENGIIG